MLKTLVAEINLLFKDLMLYLFLRGSL